MLQVSLAIYLVTVMKTIIYPPTIASASNVHDNSTPSKPLPEKTASNTCMKGCYYSLILLIMHFIVIRSHLMEEQTTTHTNWCVCSCSYEIVVVVLKSALQPGWMTGLSGSNRSYFSGSLGYPDVIKIISSSGLIKQNGVNILKCKC